MCLAVPARIVNLQGDSALVEISGNFRNTNVSLIENPQVGEYVLIHAGFAIEKVDAQTAEEIHDIENLG